MRRTSLLALSAFVSLASLITLPAIATAGGTQPVDIVLTAGPSGGKGGCDPSDQTACDLVRVRVNLGATTPTEVVTLVRAADVGETGSGPGEQAVSPDGTAMVWLERVGHSSQLWGRKFTEAKNHLLVKSGPPKEGGAGMRPEWPAWLDGDTLLFDAKTGDANGTEEKTVYTLDAPSLSSPGQPKAVLGNGITPGLGLEDVAVFPAADGTAKVVGFGPVDQGGKIVYPLSLSTLSPEGRLKGSDSRPSLGKNANGKDIESCHHPAWNLSGDRILCMVHRPMETIGGIKTRLLYSFAPSGSTWNNVGRTFEPLPMETSGLEIAPEMSAAAGCQVITYKYAQYCQSDDYVVASLFCAKEGKASGRGAEIGASRIVLVHTNPVSYLDITRLVEKDRQLPVGGLESFTATCRDAR